VAETVHVPKVLEMFKESGTHLAMVIDEYGTLEGLVTLTDILEAIVGDLPSVDEREEPKVVQREDGSWLVDGLLPVDELKELFHIKILPGEKAGYFQTLGGFAMNHLKRIPSAGDHFECCGLHFEIVDMDGHRVDKILIEQLAQPQSEDAE
jgi:putative hemolysin